jgi:hypothetical protein
MPTDSDWRLPTLTRLTHPSEPRLQPPHRDSQALTEILRLDRSCNSRLDTRVHFGDEQTQRGDQVKIPLLYLLWMGIGVVNATLRTQLASQPKLMLQWFIVQRLSYVLK